MPVQGSRDGEAVFDTDGDGVTRPPAQRRGPGTWPFKAVAMRLAPV